MDALLWILISLAAIAATSVVVTVLIVRALYRRIRRSRAITSAVLTSRAQLSRGPRRRLFTLQQQLTESLESGRAAIDLAVRSNGRRGDLPRLFRRIEDEAAALQTQLRLLESERDSVVLTGALSEAAPAVDQITDMIREVRASVTAGLGDPTGESLAALDADLAIEVAALRAGRAQLADLNSRDRADQPRTHYLPPAYPQSKGVQP
ncbi:hypothetical protein [Homoserinimonas hongtaonis]|uniref:hypothetical protein n=1 Tax=Homoserinimonas hongtaonis TaxID=2079791 RepID=UPI000D3834DE|nr:hypothetical protein [Salinibacterium hongtaonis]AWB89027.1 hypothetical protein C2138_05255 [Salinibacterium hongtaonis]